MAEFKDAIVTSNETRGARGVDRGVGMTIDERAAASTLDREIGMLQGSCHCAAVQWRFDGTPDGATACNCTVCRRYGVLWAYDFEGVGIHVSGPTQVYLRDSKHIEFHFCPTCGCVTYWRGREPNAEGQRRIAVNLRLAEPREVAAIPIDHFDGLDTFTDLPRDGRCVADYWF